MPYTDSLRDTGTLGRYVWLCLLGLALGWFEGAVVVYLRELYVSGRLQVSGHHHAGLAAGCRDRT